MKFLFLFFSILLIFSAVLVITQKNTLYSVLALVSSFLSASILILLLENEFLALFFLIIYLGAIAILFLFVVMMLNIKYKEMKYSRVYFPIGIFIGGTVFTEIWISLYNVFGKYESIDSECHNSYLNWYDIIDSQIDIDVIGQHFYTNYVVQILIAGLILYVAVLGVSFLTIKSVYKSFDKNQIILRQVTRTNNLESKQ